MPLCRRSGLTKFTVQAGPSRRRTPVNRQVIGSSPIAGATRSLPCQPSHLRQRRKRGNPHGAGSARADQIPTTGPRPGRQAGEIQPHGTRQDARERDRACGHPGGGPVIELECGSASTRPRGAGSLARGLAREWRGVGGEAGRQAGESHRTPGSSRPQHDAPRRGSDRVLPVPGLPPGSAAVVPQARGYPASAVRVVRRPGYRRGPLPGHHYRAYAEDRQRHLNMPAPTSLRSPRSHRLPGQPTPRRSAD